MQEMQNLLNFCSVMAESPFYKKLGAGGIMAIFLTAKEHDLSFMACLNGGLHAFDGKVTFSAVMVDALILKSGHKTEVLKLDHEGCRIKFTRGDRQNDPSYKPFIFEYTLEMARVAGYLSKTNWKNSPLDMLYSRCITGGGRKHCPEVFVGVLMAGELTETLSDSEIMPNLEKNIFSIQLEPQKQIESNFLPVDNVDIFRERHKIFEGEKIYDFVLSIADQRQITIDQALDQCFIYEKKFLDSFNRFLNK